MRHHRLPDGRLLAYREAGQGPPLVLLHGWAMSSAVFSEALAVLSDRFRVLVPDLRGHGGSEGGDGFGFSDFAGDLMQWAEALDLEEISLLGWSLGGQVALELYPALPGRVSRLVLVAGTPRFTAGGDWLHGLPSGQVRAMARNLKRDYRKAMGEFFALQFAGEQVPAERYRRIIDFAVRSGSLPEPEVALAALESLRTGDQRDSLEAVDCPALVVHGELDAITPAGAGRYLAENLPAGRLALLPGAGHAPFLSLPEETFDLWREFLL